MATMRTSNPSENRAAFLHELARLAAPSEGNSDAIAVETPLTGKILGDVPRNSPEDVRRAANRAREAQKSWREVPISERSNMFLRFHDLVLDRQEEALDLIQLETGKARRHALEEILDTAIVSRYYARTAKNFLKTKRRRSAFPLITSTVEHHHPKGVCAFIAPWNYPLDLAATDAIPAILAGNAALIKPDEQTPFTALWAAKLMAEAGVPGELVQIVVGSGSELGAAIIEESDFVTFTGSTQTGRIVAKRAAENLTGFSLELGGKNAMIVCEDADLDRAVIGAERAAFSGSGQLCIAAERIYVHAKIYDEFKKRLAERIGEMKLDANLDFAADMGSLASREQHRRVEAHIEDAVSKGAKILAGGKARPDIGPYFLEPTILESASEEMELFRGETFGPVAALFRFESEDEAIRLANESEYGLNFSVWTRDERRGASIAARLEAGTVGVNDAYASAWSATDAPMGGFKDSGVGRRHGEEGILKYTEPQTVSTQRIEIPVGDAGRYARVATAALKIMRRLPRRR